MDPSITFMVLLTVAIAVGSWFAIPLPWARLIIRLGRRCASLRSRTVHIDGLRWHYLEGGTGPVLLLLHGFGGDADNWLKISPYLVKQFRIIAPDLPGYGESDRPQDNSFEIEAQLRRLESFLNHVKIVPVLIAGNSMGGWLAAAYARRHQKSLSGLWLLAPLGVHSAIQSPMLKAIDNNAESPIQITDVRMFSSRVLGPMFGRLPWVPYPLRVYYGTRAVKSSVTAPGDFKQVLSSAESLEDLAPLIRTPVLLQWGDKDIAVDVSGAEVLKKSFQSLTVHVQPDIGHLPMLEAPTESCAFFMTFYKQLADQALTGIIPSATGNHS